MKKFIETGEIVKVHGILGEVKLYPWCDGTDFVKNLTSVFLTKDGQDELEIEKVRTQKNMCIIKFLNIDTVEKARELVGKVAYFSREQVVLPKGRFFAQDVIDCRVVDEHTKKEYGIITNITHPAASDIYEIKNEEGQVFLFPAVSEFLGKIDIENKIVEVRPISGMFENIGGADDAN